MVNWQLIEEGSKMHLMPAIVTHPMFNIDKRKLALNILVIWPSYDRVKQDNAGLESVNI